METSMKNMTTMELNLNDEKFVNSLVTYNMAYCFNDACPKANTCFRHMAVKFKNSNLKMGNAVYPDALQDGRCDYFIHPRIIKAAWGFHSLYNEVRLQDVGSIKVKVMSLLRGRTSYYRYHRGEKKLTPELQKSIADLFRAYGYEAPTFSHYKEMIDFTSKEIDSSSTE